jgi:periplasmic copper chaperone A
MNRLIPVAVAAATLLAPLPALAHVTLATGEAPAGGFYKAVLRVPHGCDGSPTVGLRVQIPEGVIETKPMPKPGWKIAMVVKPLDPPFVDDGIKITTQVREIDWSVGSLADDFYDEFAFRARLPSRPGATLYFPVIQICAKGEESWIQIPAQGQSADDLDNPAPGVKLTDAPPEND